MIQLKEWCTSLSFFALTGLSQNFSLLHNYRSSYQFFWQTTPAAQSLDGFWDECECAGNLRILEWKKI